jgi:hypothetical protein
LFIPGLRNNLLSVSVMEDKGYVVEFKNQHILIKQKESNSNIAQVIGFREVDIYRFQGELVLAKVHKSDNFLSATPFCYGVYGTICCI